MYCYYNKISEWLVEYLYVNLKFKFVYFNFYIKEEIVNFKLDISFIIDEKIINSNLIVIFIIEECLIFVINKEMKDFKLNDI